MRRERRKTSNSTFRIDHVVSILVKYIRGKNIPVVISRIPYASFSTLVHLSTGQVVGVAI
jgi:hypothetical protein